MQSIEQSITLWCLTLHGPKNAICFLYTEKSCARTKSTTQSDYFSPSEELNRGLQHLPVESETDCKHVANNKLKELKNVINTHHCLDLVIIDYLYK